MKLLKFSLDLPIEAVEDVTSILGTLIGMLKTGDVFAEAESRADYQETLEELNRDLADCYTLYEEWMHEPKAATFKDSLVRMNIFLIEAKKLLKNSVATVH